MKNEILDRYPSIPMLKFVITNTSMIGETMRRWVAIEFFLWSNCGKAIIANFLRHHKQARRPLAAEHEL